MALLLLSLLSLSLFAVPAARAAPRNLFDRLAARGSGGAGGQRFVVTGGVLGNPGPDAVNNWFKIEKFRDISYKIVFCPSVCRSCKVVCGDVGVVGDGGKRFLGLTDAWPFLAKFKNVKSKA
uniref:Miraculin-like n=1 Tax=Ananas comosus var. bracteatus TaxID=296719 RepID=A0A6V7QMH7_ANACO|nr:unnamed protein product [Ananas comosus var. bracteatus]